MKGNVFVGVYSVIMIVLFIVCCYLMSIVNPKPFPEEYIKLHQADSVYAIEPFPLNNNPDYGLEKIPEGVDADEFRKTTVSKYNKIDRKFNERGQRVVPPIWPNEYKEERATDNITTENKSNTVDLFATTSPVKGHRRSVNADTSLDQNDNSARVLLKIINDEGRQKIEIKLIPSEHVKKKKPRKNSRSNKLNKTLDSYLDAYQSSDLNVTDGEDKVIELKTNDVIILRLLDDSEVVLNENIMASTEGMTSTQEMSMNFTDTSLCLNKTSNNDTKTLDLQKTEEEIAGELMRKKIDELQLIPSNTTVVTVVDVTSN